MKRFLTVFAIYIVAVASIWAVSPSGSLPAIYINTEGGAPVVSKDDYLKATYWLEPNGAEGIKAIGSKDAPEKLQIKGRGNYTWIGFDKKPYRLKLDSKAALLGMKKSKHFALLAHADDDLAFLRNTMGFELSRRLGMPWTPAQEPVEVVLNGDYIGLYFLTELIRVDKDRVDIVEQPDNITNPDSITGGWLVEIDNYDDPAQIKLTEGNGAIIRVTYKTPEELSAPQESWLKEQFTNMDRAIYSADKNSDEWTRYIDIDRLARFYLVQEIMDNAESFHGSCYMHRDLGPDQKWMFGPVWDFGNSFHRGQDKYIFTNSPFGQTWIGEIYKFPAFRDAVKKLWDKFQTEDESQLDEVAQEFATKITAAAKADLQRWPNYGCKDVADRKASFMRKIGRKLDWLRLQWGEAGINTPVADDASISIDGTGFIHFNGIEPSQVRAFSVAGMNVPLKQIDHNTLQLSAPKGIYIITAPGKSIKIAL